MTCEQRKDLVFDYLSGELDAAEQDALRRHLASGCPACAGALAEAQATLASLPLALDPVVPSAAAKQRLMDRIVTAQAKASSMKLATVGDDDRLPDSPALRFFRVLVPVGIAAGIAIMVTHAAVMRRVQPELLRAQASEQMLVAKDQQIKSLLETVSNQRRVVEMLHTPELKLVQLQGAEQPNASARLLWDPKTSKWLLLATGLNPLPPEKTYELWYIPEGAKPVRAGEFNVNERGEGSVMTTLPPNLGRLALAAVTDEPAGGLADPTGKIQIKSQ